MKATFVLSYNDSSGLAALKQSLVGSGRFTEVSSIDPEIERCKLQARSYQGSFLDALVKIIGDANVVVASEEIMFLGTKWLKIQDLIARLPKTKFVCLSILDICYGKLPYTFALYGWFHGGGSYGAGVAEYSLHVKPEVHAVCTGHFVQVVAAALDATACPAMPKIDRDTAFNRVNAGEPRILVTAQA